MRKAIVYDIVFQRLPDRIFRRIAGGNFYVRVKTADGFSNGTADMSKSDKTDF